MLDWFSDGGQLAGVVPLGHGESIVHHPLHRLGEVAAAAAAAIAVAVAGGL